MLDSVALQLSSTRHYYPWPWYNNVPPAFPHRIPSAPFYHHHALRTLASSNITYASHLA